MTFLFLIFAEKLKTTSSFNFYSSKNGKFLHFSSNLQFSS